MEIVERKGFGRANTPVRFKISTLHFEMQDSSDFRFLVLQAYNNTTLLLVISILFLHFVQATRSSSRIM